MSASIDPIALAICLAVVVRVLVFAIQWGGTLVGLLVDEARWFAQMAALCFLCTYAYTLAFKTDANDAVLMDIAHSAQAALNRTSAFYSVVKTFVLARPLGYP